MGFQNANENEFQCFGNVVIWLWKSVENGNKGVLYNFWLFFYCFAGLLNLYVDHENT